jgi:hypothetical protein
MFIRFVPTFSVLHSNETQNQSLLLDLTPFSPTRLNLNLWNKDLRYLDFYGTQSKADTAKFAQKCCKK